MKAMTYTDDRLGRTSRLFESYSPALGGDFAAWQRAVEWYENRPAVGASPGERFHWCLIRLRVIDYADWWSTPEDRKADFESMARLLNPHPGN